MNQENIQPQVNGGENKIYAERDKYLLKIIAALGNPANILHVASSNELIGHLRKIIDSDFTKEYIDYLESVRMTLQPLEFSDSSIHEIKTSIQGDLQKKLHPVPKKHILLGLSVLTWGILMTRIYHNEDKQTSKPEALQVLTKRRADMTHDKLLMRYQDIADCKTVVKILRSSNLCNKQRIMQYYHIVCLCFLYIPIQQNKEMIHQIAVLHERLGNKCVRHTGTPGMVVSAMDEILNHEPGLLKKEGILPGAAPSKNVLTELMGSPKPTKVRRGSSSSLRTPKNKRAPPFQSGGSAYTPQRADHVDLSAAYPTYLMSDYSNSACITAEYSVAHCASSSSSSAARQLHFPAGENQPTHSSLYSMVTNNHCSVLSSGKSSNPLVSHEGEQNDKVEMNEGTEHNGNKENQSSNKRCKFE